MKYDVIVIGSGPGGYVAAIRCAQLGFKTAIIERYSVLGGTCLNVGCIPSKALLDSSEHFHNAKHNFAAHGIGLNDLQVDMPQMIARKAKVVLENGTGIKFLMKKNKIDVHYGHASFNSKNKIKVSQADGTSSELETTYTIIATGSKPIVPPVFNYDKKRIITSTEALNIAEVPSTMTVIGGGVIGLELGSVYARLGTKVRVVEFADRLIAGMDKELGKELEKVLKKLGFEFYFNHKVTGVSTDGTTTTLTAENMSGGDALVLEADYTLIAIGRKPYTDGLGLENAGVEVDERGRIKTNDHSLETTASGIYAIGDVVKGAMLAHKAEEEGTLVAEILAGQKPHINYNLIPGVVYTWPEVSAVGKTEEELQSAGANYKVGKFPFSASGRARASMDTDGFVKVLADSHTDEILGVHIIGPRAADMIGEAVIAMEFRASAEDISRSSHAHPTFMEALREAALDATDKRAIHK